MAFPIRQSNNITSESCDRTNLSMYVIRSNGVFASFRRSRLHTCHNLKWFVIKFQVQKEILTTTTKTKKRGRENVPKMNRDICVFAIETNEKKMKRNDKHDLTKN